MQASTSANNSKPRREVDLAAIAGAVQDIYARLDAEIARVKPRCEASGRCCHFEQYGHRLYVTAAEMLAFDAATGPLRGTAASAGLPPHGAFPLPLLNAVGEVNPGCPWQIGGLCTARAGRPLGCRVYFCDAATAQWQHEAYERYHNELARLHERFGIGYSYTEWRQALQSLPVHSGGEI